jgi:RNA-directed DNA polymerase
VTETAHVLRPLGLTLSLEETHITHIDEGVDFVGWRIKRDCGRRGRPGIFLFPSKAALATVMAKIKEITRSGTNQSLDQLLHRLNPVLRGWCAYSLRAMLADLPIPAPIHVAAGHRMAATQVPQAQLALAATPPPPRVVADRQGNGALQPGGGQHHPLPLPGSAHRNSLAVGPHRFARRGRLPRATAIPVRR